MPNKRALSTEAQKIEWLIVNHLLWEHMTSDDYSCHPWTGARLVVKQMVGAGLVSKFTYVPDVRLKILIPIARKRLQEIQ